MKLSVKFMLAIGSLLYCNSYGGTTIPIEINDGGYIFIKVKINGSTEARFMVDTGAGVSVISEQLFEKLKPSLKQDGLHTGTRHNGEQITGMLFLLPELSIGMYSQKNVAVGVYNRLMDFDGLLSLDYFREAPFTIDFANKRLTIEERNDLTDIKRNGISIPVEIQMKGKRELQFFVDLCFDDNVRCRAEFDTGAGFNMLMLHPRYIKEMALKVPAESVNYGYYIFSTTLSSLKYCSNAEKLVSLNVFAGFKEGLIYDGLVGSGMFRNSQLTINIPGSEMIVRR